MLNALRNAAGTWVAKLLLVLLVASFAVWGISGQLLGGVGTASVITAGGTKVSMQDYRLAYDRQITVLSQQLGMRLTRDQAKAFGLDGQVLTQLVSGALLDEQARKMSLGVSKDRLALLARDDPAFRGPGGQFDRQVFDYMLRQIGMRPEDYLRNRQQVAVRQQIVEAVSDGIRTPDTFLRAIALYRGEDRTAEWLMLPNTLVQPIEPPADAALQAWFDARKSNYAAPEYRKFSYIKLEPADIADESAVTDEQIRQDYDQQKARYTTPEQRTIEQIVFADAAAANAAAGSIANGATFDKIATETGKSAEDINLGTLTKDQIADRAVAEAAFALQLNAVSPVVQGAFGPVLLRVTEIKPESVRPVEEVAAAIRKALAVSEASRILLDVHDSYEDARADGVSFADAAERLKLKVVTVEAISNRGARPDDSIVNDLPQSAELIRGVFDAEVRSDNRPIAIGGDGFVFYEVEGITPARDRTLDEVRTKVVADWTAAETSIRLEAKAADLEKRLKDGQDFDALAAEVSGEKQTKRGLRREGDDVDFGKPGIAAAFSVKEGGVGRFPTAAGDGQILFKVTEVFEPAAASPDAVDQQTRTALASGLADDLLDQLVARLQGEFSVTVDQAAIDRALAL